MAPQVAVLNTWACACCKRCSTGADGWPKRLRQPLCTRATLGCTACNQAAEVELLLHQERVVLARGAKEI